MHKIYGFRMNLKIIIYLLIIISFASVVSASTIYGTVYDSYLKKAKWNIFF